MPDISDHAPVAAALSTLAMVAIMATRYMFTSGFFAWLTRRTRPDLLAGRGSQIAFEIRASLLATLIYAIPAGVVAWGWQERGWTLIYERASDYPLWWMPVSVLLFLIAHDTWFYWTHRLLHRPRIFRAAHAVHHASRAPTAWAAMSFHPLEAITGAVVIPALVFLIPIHIAALGLVLFIMTVMGITNHMGWEIFPDRLVHSHVGNWLITASHHGQHHEHYSCNYGLYFRFWDHVCGTDRGLSRL